ncbi:transporter substrate-binding domain-containing protein [Massilia sp. H-1]|nr:transporter substrate-binding domain-containing protein [Massilia sp. H-1]
MASAVGLLGAVLLILLPMADSAACTKTVRWFDDPPYSFRQADGQIGGFDADLAREVLRRTGCSARFVNMPWARALVELESGNLDVLPGSFRSQQRERYAYFSIPVQQTPNVLYLSPAAAEKYRPATLAELGGTPFRLGVQIGVSYGEHFEALKASPAFHSNLVPVTLRRNAWRMMQMGRIDGMIADEASAEVELRQLGLEQTLLPSKIVVPTDPVMFAFSKASVTADFVAAFDKQLQTLITNGQYRKLRERYFPCGRAGAPTACK